MQRAAYDWTWTVRLRPAILGAGLLGCGPSVTGSGGEGTDDGSSGATATVDADATDPGPTATGVGDEGTTTTTTGTADGSTGDEVVPCEDPVPILQAGVDAEIPTGWVQCASGKIHRVMPVACEVPMPVGRECGSLLGQCASDADCTELPYGACREFGGFPSGCECVYGCASDDDCAPNQICACAGDAEGYPSSATCVISPCVDTEGCTEGLCAIGAQFSCTHDRYRAGCTTAMDTCSTDDDCDGACYPQPDAPWACEPPGPICAPPGDDRGHDPAREGD